MRNAVTVFCIASMLLGVAAQASEAASVGQNESNYVVEPIFKSNNWNCPPKTKIIAKYCWQEVYGSFMRCGYVCHPTNEVGGGRNFPHP
ncbi:MAG: hypothetical protein ACXVCP_03390 [Bdellovibrio sp.]